jgi:hypothetical protein
MCNTRILIASQIAFTHSSMLGGSSDSVYRIPKPPPTFNSVIAKHNQLLYSATAPLQQLNLDAVGVQKFENQYGRVTHTIKCRELTDKLNTSSS